MSYIKPWVAGAVIAVVAVLTGAFLITDTPVYGFCVACHARDLVSGTPMLTTVGLVIGAVLGARTSGEVQNRPAGRPIRSFVLGALAMVSGLVALGCMTRLLLRAAYGDTLAYWAVGGVAAGISLATGILAWRARRWAA